MSIDDWKSYILNLLPDALYHRPIFYSPCFYPILRSNFSISNPNTNIHRLTATSLSLPCSSYFLMISTSFDLCHSWNPT